MRRMPGCGDAPTIASVPTSQSGRPHHDASATDSVNRCPPPACRNRSLVPCRSGAAAVECSFRPVARSSPSRTGKGAQAMCRCATVPGLPAWLPSRSAPVPVRSCPARHRIAICVATRREATSPSFEADGKPACTMTVCPVKCVPTNERRAALRSGCETDRGGSMEGCCGPVPPLALWRPARRCRSVSRR